MAVMQVPEQSLEQRRAALREANRIRSHRAYLKRQLRRREVTPADLFSDPDCATMKVAEILMATPLIGRVKAYRILRHASVSPSKTVGGMSERQRRDLTEALS